MQNLEYFDDFVLIILLWYITFACLIGSYSNLFAGTILQRLGMGLISIWAVWESYNVMNTKIVSSEIFFASAGISVFITGTILKTYLWKRRHVRENS